MDCRKVRGMLLTDYLDRELGAQESSEVDQHLAQCVECRGFFEKAVSMMQPLKQNTDLIPDQHVWQMIEDRILVEKERSVGLFGKLLDAVMPLLQGPGLVLRGAFFSAAVIVILLLTLLPLRSVDPAYAYLGEQMTFLSELQSGNAELLNGELSDYTAILEAVAN